MARSKALKLLAALLGTYYERLAHYHSDVGGLVPDLSEDCECTATRTATWLVRTGTQWTKRLRQIIENPLNMPNFRTHKDELERLQANS